MQCPIENHIMWHRPSVKTTFLLFASHSNIIPFAGHAVYSPQRRREEGKYNWMGKEGYAATQGNWN